MVFEFIIYSSKFIAVFTGIFYVLGFLLFKINVNIYSYYYYRNTNLTLSKELEFNNIKTIFKPVFKETKFNENTLYISTKVLNNYGFMYENDKISFIKK